MRVRALDSNGDWEYGKGQNDYKVNRDAVQQNIQTRLSSFLGDCFFDTGAGINWFGFLGGKDQLGLNLSVSAIILNTQFVLGMIQLSIVLDPVSRNLVIRYSVNTAFGALTGTLAQTISELVFVSEDDFTFITEGGTVLVTE